MATTIDYIIIIPAAMADAGFTDDSTVEASVPRPDSDDQQHVPSKRYTLTFKEDSLPPVQAFWSLTMRDVKTHLLITNELDRYQLNSSTDQLKLDSNGSLVVHISRQSPGRELEANWLLAPSRPFYLVLQLNEPMPKAFERSWNPPQLQSVHCSSP